ncbi:DUF402 domain-containing protein [Xylocopilactobacillus apis]|uniref:DUF402 domain-containing protein n=1 Tax=Xylocopilactobacillus apis TaxID=2932183 RepID=A0AAU9DEY4_9LACO|nr:DUF402 domain-containing protein [Xylocopilactobacillus apis]BDR56776.1 hypothetical protein KIMC2_13380 [Xylocopilactobacillus apis]
MVLPKEGDYIAIQSFKHNGLLHRTWKESMVLKVSEDILIGGNNHTLVTESDRHRWITREPAIIYFHKHYWFNVIAMIRETGVVYYCNLASPYVIDREALKYIDYDLDVKVFANGEKRLLDLNEYEENKRKWHYSKTTDEILKYNVKVLVYWINHQLGPFSKEFIDIWYGRYIELLHK